MYKYNFYDNDFIEIVFNPNNRADRESDKKDDD